MKQSIDDGLILAIVYSQQEILHVHCVRQSLFHYNSTVHPEVSGAKDAKYYRPMQIVTVSVSCDPYSYMHIMIL